MIKVVSLNPCIDWQYALPVFAPGGLNRVRHTRQDIAGKGINVAAALKNLGLSPMCTGVNFKENGHLLTDKLDALEIPHSFTEVDGAIRVNIKLYEESTGVMTELNQPGGLVPSHALENLRGKILNREGSAGTSDDILILSGSYPQGIPPCFYSEIISGWHGKVILDAEGEALQLAVSQPQKPPYAIKPNIYELESAFKVTLPNPKDISAFCQNLARQTGMKIICVSMGKNGAVIATEGESYYLPALDITPRGVHGAGDAMVAGLAYAMVHNLPIEEYLPTAMATAAATVVRDGTEMCSLDGFEAMRKKIPC